MMSRVMKVQVMVDKAVAEGYELLGSGLGSYDKALASNRAEGYDVRCWYTSITKSGRAWIMYGKKKDQKRKHAVFSNDPFTGKTFYHGFQEETKPTVDYSAMTVKQLKDICKEKKVAGYSKMNKSQMINVLGQAY